MEKKLESLSSILKSEGDLVLGGRAKLCLHLDEVLFLNKYQLAQHEDFVPVEFTSVTINFILDFIQKAKAAKICGDETCCEYLSFQHFKKIRYLEIYNIPIEIITDVHFLKERLRHLTLHRSCSDLTSFLLSESPDEVWVELTRAILRFNNITEIHGSLARITPNLRHLDLSHNQIRDVSTAFCGLQNLEHLNLSFNLLEDIPAISSTKLDRLDIQHNNIKMLDGFYDVNRVIVVDLSGNCLEYLEQLSPLGSQGKLRALRLSGNPVAYNPNYRVGVFKELNHHINADVFQLDSIPVSLREYKYLSMPSNAIRVTNSAVTEVVMVTGSRSTPQKEPDMIPRRGSTGTPRRTSSRKVSRQKIKLESECEVNPIQPLHEHQGEPDYILDEDRDVARSMQEKYGAQWLEFFGQRGDRGNNTIIPESRITVEDVIRNVMSSSEDEEEDEGVEGTDRKGNDGVIGPILGGDGGPPVDGNDADADAVSLGRDSEEENAGGDGKEKEIEVPDPYERQSSSRTDIYLGDDDDGDGDGNHDLECDVDDSDVTSHLVLSQSQDIFVAVKNQSIREKDTLGQYLDTLDINCLTNFIDEGTNIKLYFNHTSSNRKFRSYDFRTPSELRDFLRDIEPVWREVRDQNFVYEEVKCLNCDQIMSRSDIDGVCRLCGSSMIAHLNEATPPASFQSTTFIPPPPSSSSSHGPPPTSRPDSGEEASVISSVPTTRTALSYTSHTNTFLPQASFVKADHRLDTFFDLELFKRDDEVLCCYLYCEYSRYEKKQTSRCVLVVSNHMVYICKLVPGAKPALRYQHRMSNLRHLDIGMNGQYFRLEWPSRGASYKILVYDRERCDAFINIFSLAMPKSVQVHKVSNATIEAINELVFGIDKTFELLAKAKAYHNTLKNANGKFAIMDRTSMFKVYNKCIPGCDLVEWLVSQGEVDSRALAVDLCQQMLTAYILQHVKYEEQFHDDQTLYRFAMDEEDYSSHHNYVIEDNANKEITCYQMCYLYTSGLPKSISLIMSNANVFLTSEYHQWPLPRLQPPLPHHLRGQHFQVLHDFGLTDITVLQYSRTLLSIATSHRTFELEFSSEASRAEVETKIAKLWETMFGFPLERQEIPD